MFEHAIQILLIEDNPGDANLIRRMLTYEGARFELTTVETLREGLAMCTSSTFDVALLDLSLPDSTGLETLQKLRAASSALPIVVLTGYDDRRVGVQAVHSGAQDYLVKGEVSGGLLHRALHYAIERQATQAQLLAIAAFEERQRLARDLHDSVSQTLFSTSVVAETVLRKFRRDPDATYALLQELHGLTRSALAEMRLMLLELRPRAFDQAPLETLLGHLRDSVQGRDGLKVYLDLGASAVLPYDQKLAVYRITQEALNNVVKHAHATQVWVRLGNSAGAEGDSARTLLSIRDDGQGFNLDAGESASLGLGIMRERAKAAGATIRIVSAPGQGTEVTVGWPERDPLAAGG